MLFPHSAWCVAASLAMTLASTPLSAQSRPTTGYAPVNGLRMYYEVHGRGEPVVLLHGAFMTITNNWAAWIGTLAKTRQVIAVEMQGHGRTADFSRTFSSANHADDVAALLTYLKIPRADLIGYSMGGGVAMQMAVRHPQQVRKVVVISASLNRDGMIPEGREAVRALTAELFTGSPIETEYKRLSPTPTQFATFIQRMVSGMATDRELTAKQLAATSAPMFFIHGDADGIQFEHMGEMFRAKGGGTHGDMGPRTASRLAILPNTSHVTLMDQPSVIIPMISDFLDANPKSPRP
jgi:pimeloyl-ACP methyl ester carboxylesterase